MGILEYFSAEVNRSTLAKIAEKSEKDSEALIALSTAIDLYDRNEDEEAKRKLNVARKIDPESEAAAYFLTKLTANTTRFKVLMEQYYSYLNPAFLGIMEEDELHVAGNTPVYPIVTHNPIERVNYTAFGTDKAISEMDFNTRLGYAFPIGERWGMRVEVLPTVGSLNRGWQGDYDPDTTELNTQRTAAGAVFDFGFRTSETVAFGAGPGLYSRSASDRGPVAPYTSPDKLLVMGNIGFLIRNPDQTLLFDSRLGFNNETYEVCDADTLTLSGEAAARIYLENTLTLAFQENTTFFIVKQIDSFSLDRSYTFMTAMPAVERFVRAGMDLDLNFTWRQRPSRVVEGLLYSDMMVLMNLTRSGLRVQRQ